MAVGNVESGRSACFKIENVAHLSETRSQQGHLEQADECWRKQSLIINPFAIFWVSWAGERKEH